MGVLLIGVLGPLTVSVDGRPVVVTAARLRAVLAVLALSAGEPVSTDRLAAAVWGEDLPKDARRAIQVYVTRLRGLLGTELIRTVSDGYLLMAEPDRVDALRFVRLLDAAGRAPDPDAERALLVEALALWRGEPFEDAQSAWLDSVEASRLVDRRLAALERRIALDLDRYRSDELIAELQGLTARYPLREMFWGQLMTALERAGRRTDALEAYQRLRGLLGEELGIEPGHSVQDVHERILKGDAGSSFDPPAPRQLPAGTGYFVGRSGSLAQLDALLDPGGPTIATITGPAGVGKTALAVHWAHRVRHRFPDGQLYVNLRGFDPSGSVLDPADAIRGFLQSLAAPESVPADLPAQAGLYRSLLADRRLLVVLDNAREPAQVRPLLPGSAGSRVLVTSRIQLTGLVAAEGAHPVRLDLFSRAEARHLVARRLGEVRVAAERDAVEKIIERSAGLPLALALVAARAAANPAFPLSALAAQLQQAAGSLDEFASADAATDLRTVFSWSYRALSPAAARLFRLLALPAAPDISAAAAARLAGLPERQVRPLLTGLCEAQLLTEHRPGRYTMHDLLRAYALELATEHDDHRERAAAIVRVLGFYLATAWRTVPVLAPGDRRMDRADRRWRDGGLELADEATALAWLDAERANLLAAAQQAVSTPGVPEEIAVQLAHALYGYFSVHPHWNDWAFVNEIAVAAARRLGDRAAEALATYDLGFVGWLRGRRDEARARYADSLAICRELGDRAGVAASLAGLGDVHRVLNAPEQAIARYEQSLAICRELGDLRGQTMSLGSLGMLYQGQGRSTEALDCLRESLAIRERLGDRRGQATSLTNLGTFYQREARYAEALACYEQSLDMRREQGDRHGQGTSLAGLGAIYQQTRRLAEALAYQRESVAIFRDLADEPCLATTLHALGVTLQALGRTEDAEQHRREATELFQRLGTPEPDPAAPTGRAPVKEK